MEQPPPSAAAGAGTSSQGGTRGMMAWEENGGQVRCPARGSGWNMPAFATHPSVGILQESSLGVPPPGPPSPPPSVPVGTIHNSWALTPRPFKEQPRIGGHRKWASSLRDTRGFKLAYVRVGEAHSLGRCQLWGAQVPHQCPLLPQHSLRGPPLALTICGSSLCWYVNSSGCPEGPAQMTRGRMLSGGIT